MNNEDFWVLYCIDKFKLEFFRDGSFFPISQSIKIQTESSMGKWIGQFYRKVA